MKGGVQYAYGAIPYHVLARKTINRSEVHLDEQTKTASSANPQLTRKPYQKPAFRFEKVFETRALTCGKINPTQESCVHNRKNS